MTIKQVSYYIEIVHSVHSSYSCRYSSQNCEKPTQFCSAKATAHSTSVQ